MTSTDRSRAVPGVDAAVAGRRAECDGGHAIAGTHFAGRQDFAGTLTGDFVDSGDPPWRWYLLGDLTLAPAGYAHDTVWCDSDSLFLVGDSKRDTQAMR